MLLTSFVSLQFLAEAIQNIYGSYIREHDVIAIDDVKSQETILERVDVEDAELPGWAKALEPVRKLPTNVGARIRRCINEALDKSPPEWAKKVLEHSISKSVYRGNASGPTKVRFGLIIVIYLNLKNIIRRSSL